VDTPHIPDNERNLDEFDSENRESAGIDPVMAVVEPGAPPQTARTPAPFSRVEAVKARRARKSLRARVDQRARAAATGVVGYSLALCALIALRCDSFASATNRSWQATARSRRPTMPAENSTLSHLESEGSVVAAMLAVAAVGYGSLLVMSWGEPAPRGSASTIAALSPVAEPADAAPVPTLALATAAPMPTLALATVAPTGRLVARPRARAMTASTLSTIWRRSDTRSLQQAFTSLRRETLAFHRCGLQITGSDRAVARCDGFANQTAVRGDAAGRRVTWTIDFRRTGDRWAIQRVSSR
jgi:hypothetical protein